MKRLLVTLVAFFAGALVASARVAWLPLTAEEVVAFNKAQVNYVSIGLGKLNSDGSLTGVSLFGFNRSQFRGIGIFAETSNHIAYVVRSCLKTITPGTNQFQVCVHWEASYYSSTGELVAGDNIVGDLTGDQISGQSPLFQFPASGEIPPEAFQIEADWLFGDTFLLIFPVKGQGIRWVEWSLHQEGEGGVDIDELTSNGMLPYPQDKVDVLKLPIGMIGSWENGPNNWPPPSWWRLILWYDEGRTDGTVFEWLPGSQVVRREILPQQLSIALSGGLLKVTLSGGVPGGTYVLEPVSALSGSIQTQANVLPPPTAVADTNGVATWSLHPTGVGEFFRARLR